MARKPASRPAQSTAPPAASKRCPVCARTLLVNGACARCGYREAAR